MIDTTESPESVTRRPGSLPYPRRLVDALACLLVFGAICWALDVYNRLGIALYDEQYLSIMLTITLTYSFLRFPVRGKTRTAPLEVEVKQLSISRAVADAPLAAAKDLLSQAERLKQGWRVNLFLSAGALNGFDPDTNRRLGFTYQISDYHREDQFLGAGRAFPLGDNPSLWTTLELRD